MLGKLVGGWFSDDPTSGGATTVVVECRRCGASLDDGVDRCPHCGDTDTARFEF